MKSKILKTFLFFVLFSVILITASYATPDYYTSVKEDVSTYETNKYIIGSTRIDAKMTVTVGVAANAGWNDARAKIALGENILVGKMPAIYTYDPDFEEWNEVKEDGTTRLLKEEEVKELEENLNIFFVNNEEKILEVPYAGNVDEGSIWSPNDNVTFENGKFHVPVFTHSFTFLSNNVPNEVKTNVIESVLKGEEVTENIDIVPEWASFKINGEYYEKDDVNEVFASKKELEVKLLRDTDLKTAVEVTSKVTFDLNGCTLTAKTDTEGNGIFWVKTGGDLTINGEGTIDSACQTNDYSMAIWATGTGKVTINGGTFKNIGAKSVEDDGVTPNNNELIYASANGQITINGGTFMGNTDNEEYHARFTLNLKDADAKAGTAKIMVKGGTFVGYNPAASKSENPVMDFLADGYKVVPLEDYYYVEPVLDEDIVLVNGITYPTLPEAVTNAPEGAIITLLKDIDVPTALVINKKLTFELNGCTLTAKTDTVGDGIFKVITGGDLTINGEGTIDSACQTNDYSMAIWATGTGKVTINGGTFTNRGAKSVEDDGVTPNNNELIYASVNGQIIINGGTFMGNTDNEEYHARFTLNLKDADGKAGTAKIIVKGGTFTGYDPANSKSENPTQDLVADGYVSNGVNDIYTVKPIAQ